MDFGSASSLEGFAGVLKRQDGAVRIAKLAAVPHAHQPQRLLAHAIGDSHSRDALGAHDADVPPEPSSPQRAAGGATGGKAREASVTPRRGVRTLGGSHITIAPRCNIGADGPTSVPGGQLRRLRLAEENERLRLHVSSLDDVIGQLQKEHKLLLPRAVTERAAQAQAQQLQVDYDKKLAAERKQHAGELATREAALEQARDAIKAEQLKLQSLEDSIQQERARVKEQMCEREEQMREQLQSVHVQADAELEEMKEAHAKRLEKVREEGQEALNRMRNRHNAMETELEKAKEEHSATIERLSAELRAKSAEASHQTGRCRTLTRELEATGNDLGAARKRNLELEGVVKQAQADGAEKTERQRQKANEFEVELEALSKQHAQLEIEAAGLRGTVETMSVLKTQLDEALRSKEELRSCLNEAQEKIDTFDIQMEGERTVIKQQQHKMATLQNEIERAKQVTAKAKAETESARAELKLQRESLKRAEEFGQALDALEQALDRQIDDLSKAVVSGHHRVAEFNQEREHILLQLLHGPLHHAAHAAAASAPILGKLESATSALEALQDRLLFIMSRKQESQTEQVKADGPAEDQDSKKQVQRVNRLYAKGKTTETGKDGFVGTFGNQEVFFDGLEAHGGRVVVADDTGLLEEMRREYHACQDPRIFHITTSNYGELQSDLITEWEFAAEPRYVRLYPGQHGGPSLKSNGARTRQPIPLSKLMAHPYVKMTNLRRVEVLALRLWTGPSFVVLNGALRHALYKKGKKNCLPDLRSLQFDQLDQGGKGFITLEELKEGLASVIKTQGDQEATKHFKALIESGPRFTHRFSDSHRIQEQEFYDFVSMESGCGKRDWGACKSCKQCHARCNNEDCLQCNTKDAHECPRKDFFRCRHKMTSCFKCAPGCDSFANTIAAINSAITKLTKVTNSAQARVLYRGIHGMAYPEDLLEIGGNFVEFGFSSCSPDKNVALKYSRALECTGHECEAFAHDEGICDQHKPTILQVSTGQLDCGAELKWISQFPDDDEHVLGPLSHFEVVGMQRELMCSPDTYTLNVIEVKLNRNLQAKTLEQLREARKDICVQIANGLLQEMQQLLSGEISMFISTEQIEGKMISTLQQDAECFNEALHFQKKVNELFTEYCAFLSDAASKLHAHAEFMVRGPASPTRNTHIEAIIRRAITICHRIEENPASGKEQDTHRLARLYDLASIVMAVDESGYAEMLVEKSQSQAHIGNNLAAVTLLDQALCLMGDQKSNAKLTGSERTKERVANVLYKKGLLLTKTGELQQALHCLVKGLTLAEACATNSQLLEADILKAMGVVVVMRGSHLTETMKSLILSSYLFEEALSRQICTLRDTDRKNDARQVVDASLLDHLRNACRNVGGLTPAAARENSDHIGLIPCRIFKVMTGQKFSTSTTLHVADVIHTMLDEAASSCRTPLSSLIGEWGARALVALLNHDEHLVVEARPVIETLLEVIKAHSADALVVGECLKGLLSVLKAEQTVKVDPSGMADHVIKSILEVLDVHNPMSHNVQVLETALMVMHRLIGGAAARETWVTRSMANEGGEHMDGARVTAACDSTAQLNLRHVCPVTLISFLLKSLKIWVKAHPNMVNVFTVLDILDKILNDHDAGESMQKALLYGARHAVRVQPPNLIQAAVGAFPQNDDIKKLGRLVYDKCCLPPPQRLQSEDENKTTADARISEAVQRVNDTKGVVQHQTALRLHAAIKAGSIFVGGSWVMVRQAYGTEITNEKLVEVLHKKLCDEDERIGAIGVADLAPEDYHIELSAEERESLSMESVLQDSYVKVDENTLFQPAESLENLLLNPHEHVNAVDQKSQTALFLASSRGLQDAVAMLLKARANVHLPNFLGQTPLWKSAENGHVDVLQMLISAKASVNVTDRDGDTAVSAAAYCGQAGTLQELIQAGAKVEAAFVHQTSPMAWAAIFGHVPVIELLIKAGADANAPDKHGRTPLDLAMLPTDIHPTANKKACFLLRAAGGKAGSLGLKWTKVGSSKPEEGTEFQNAELAKALHDAAMVGKLDVVFTRNEFDRFNVSDLSTDNYIEVGSSSAGPLYFKPAAVSKLTNKHGESVQWHSPSYSARSSTRASGLRWVMTSEPSQGHQITNNMLARALAHKTEFDQEEWDAFGIQDLRIDHFIQSGASFFSPAQTPDCRACGKPIQDSVTNALSKTWHADCFKCTNCGKKLVPGSWTSRDDDPYCKWCIQRINNIRAFISDTLPQYH